MIQMYVVTKGGNIVILNGTQDSFRCRQRNRLQDGTRVEPFKFVSYRSMLKENRKNKKNIYKGLEYAAVSRL